MRMACTDDCAVPWQEAELALTQWGKFYKQSWFWCALALFFWLLFGTSWWIALLCCLSPKDPTLGTCSCLPVCRHVCASCSPGPADVRHASEVSGDVLCRYISEMGAVFVLLEPCQPRARGGFSSPVSHKQSHIGTAGSSLSRSSMAALQSKEMRAQMLVAASPFSHSSELLWNGMQNGVPNGTPSGPPTSLSPASTTAGASVRVQPQGVSAMGLPEL